MKSKFLFTAVIICLFVAFIIGSEDRKEVDDMTYVIAIGIDKGKTNVVKMTLQYVLPLATGVGTEGGGGKPVSNLTIECPTILAGINMANNFIGKQINFAHAKVLVFSEDIAKTGDIKKYLHIFQRVRDFRPTLYVAISTASAKEFIESIEPQQGADPTKYYDLKFAAYKYTGFTANTQMQKFYNLSEGGTEQQVATLVGTSKYKSSEDFDLKDSTYKEKGREKPLEGDYFAGDLPKTGDTEGETMGLAVLKDMKMVGKLDGEDATSYLMVTGEYKSSFITFPDPKAGKDYYIVVNTKQSRQPEWKVKMIEGKPQISGNVKLEGDFLSIQSDIDYGNDELKILFEKSAEEFIKENIIRFLKKTVELDSDICGFGKFAKSNTLTWKEWMDIKWHDNYKKSTFDVNVDMKIRRPGLIIKTETSESQQKGGEE